MFEKQSIGGAAKQENQQVACTSGEIALDVESLPCANGCSEAPNPNLAVGKCPVDQDQKSGAHTTLQTESYFGFCMASSFSFTVGNSSIFVCGSAWAATMKSRKSAAAPYCR